MPNLVGVFSPTLAEAAVARTLTMQLERVKVPGVAYVEHRAAAAGFGMALQDNGLTENGPQPAATPDGSAILILDGEIHNTAELRRRFARELPQRARSTPELCLHLLLAHGADAAALLDGFFCIAMYQLSQRRLTLFCDRYGARPLFYAHRQDRTLFATEVKAIAAVDPARREIDEVAALELFSYGTHFNDRVWLKDYRRLTPASVLEIDAGGARHRRFWSRVYAETAPKSDATTRATVFGVLFDRAVERRMAGTKRIGMFLSGGYDSRAVAAAIRPEHRPLPAFTFGVPESRDVRFAAMLASRLGLEHHWLDTQGPYLHANCRSIVWRTEGMLPFANTTSIHYHDTLAGRMDVILTGFLGEYSGSHTWPALLLARSHAAAKAAIFERYLRGGLERAKRLFQPEFFARTSQAVRERFDRSFDDIRNEHPVNVADTWNFEHLQPHGTFLAPSVDRHRFEMRAPHCDNQLVDYLLTIPPNERLEQRIYKKMIAWSFPSIRDVPCTNSARPIDPNFAREYAAMVVRYVARKAVAPVESLLSPRQRLQREFRDLDAQFRAEPALIEDILRPLLRAGVFPTSIFDHAAIDALVAEHYEGGGRHQKQLGLLISLGLAVKYFIDGDLADVPAEIYAP